MGNSGERRLSMRTSITLLIAAPFLAIGWLVGAAKRAAKLAWSAIIEGYQAGSKL